MTVGLLAPPAPLTRQEILDKLAYWRERLHEAQGGTNTPTEPHCQDMLDKYLQDFYAIEPNARFCRLPEDEMEWTCTWCGRDVSGMEPAP